ncbi:MAG: hypothetical protein NUK63_04530 [Candidatus Bathyarchaeum tardum]|nr:MAG: hypothetical protein NUK63_04530 [Candidatus Bathyarchaeum tardum]
MKYGSNAARMDPKNANRVPDIFFAIKYRIKIVIIEKEIIIDWTIIKGGATQLKEYRQKPNKKIKGKPAPKEICPL